MQLSSELRTYDCGVTVDIPPQLADDVLGSATLDTYLPRKFPTEPAAGPTDYQSDS